MANCRCCIHGSGVYWMISLTANSCSPGPAPWRCADCACRAANAPSRTARPATSGKVRSDRVRFGYRGDARGLRPARLLLASALPFHLFDVFLKRRVLAAYLVDAPLELPQLRLASGADPVRSLTDMPWPVGHWSAVWPWSADGVPRPSDCSMSSSCLSRSVNSIARRRNWCATAERRCSSSARRSSRSMVFTVSQSALP
jgi:hypothetical protein